MSSYLIIFVMLFSFGFALHVAKKILVRRKRKQARSAGFNTGEIKKISSVFTGEHQASNRRLVGVILMAALVAVIAGATASLVLASIGKLAKVSAVKPKQREPNITVLIIEEEDDASVDAGVVDSSVDRHVGDAQVLECIPDAVVKQPSMDVPVRVRPRQRTIVRPTAMSAMRAPSQVTQDDIIRALQKASSVRKQKTTAQVPASYFLRKCGRGKVIHVRGRHVRCLKPGSEDANKLLKRGLKNHPQRKQILRKIPPVMRQSVFASAPGIGKDVAKRKTIFDKLAEVIYFMLTLMGVICRLWWDHSLECRKNSISGTQSTKFNFTNLILAPFLAIAVHMVLTQSMSGAYNALRFQGVLLAVYNGFVWPVLIKDISDFKNLRPIGKGTDDGQANLDRT